MTRIDRLCSYFLLVFSLHVASHASDRPFGADSLNYLTEEASDIVKASPADSSKSQKLNGSSSNYDLHTIVVEETIKGVLLPKEAIVIAVRRTREVSGKVIVPRGVVFLRNYNPEQDVPLGVSSVKDPYIVVSGEFGVVQATSPLRVKAIADYAASGSSTTSALDWVDRHIVNNDRFLQRSAAVDLFLKADEPRAQVIAEKALKLPSVRAENKMLAVDTIESANSPTAIPLLTQIAENELNPQALRAAAVRAVSKLPGGKLQLERWQDSGSVELKPLVKQLMAPK